MDKSGNLYGTTYGGGAYGAAFGTVFEISNIGASPTPTPTPSDLAYAIKSAVVSVPLGARINVPSVTQSGTSITVNGTGFSTLTVINFFATTARRGVPWRAYGGRRGGDTADADQLDQVHF